MKWLSPTADKMYIWCPLSYKDRYIDGNKPPESEPLRGGRAVHAAADRLASAEHTDGRGWEKALIDRAAAAFRASWAENAEPEDDMKHFGRVFGTYVKTIIRRVKKAKSVKMGLATAFPEKTETWLRSKEFFHHRGIVDEMTPWVSVHKHYKERWIVDLKTGKTPPVPHDWENELQVNLYACMYIMEYDKPPDGMAIWYLVDDVWVIYPFDWDRANEAAAWAIYCREGIDKGNFEPTKNVFCDWRDCKERCPLFGGQASVGDTKGAKSSKEGGTNLLE